MESKTSASEPSKSPSLRSSIDPELATPDKHLSNHHRNCPNAQFIDEHFTHPVSTVLKREMFRRAAMSVPPEEMLKMFQEAYEDIYGAIEREFGTELFYMWLTEKLQTHPNMHFIYQAIVSNILTTTVHLFYAMLNEEYLEEAISCANMLFVDQGPSESFKQTSSAEPVSIPQPTLHQNYASPAAFDVDTSRLPCHDYENGRCARGTLCRYSHGEYDAAPSTDSEDGFGRAVQSMPQLQPQHPYLTTQQHAPPHQPQHPYLTTQQHMPQWCTIITTTINCTSTAPHHNRLQHRLHSNHSSRHPRSTSPYLEVYSRPN